MTTTEKIVTLARRYCIDNFRYWADKYQNERTGNDFPYTYTDKDYDLFPRYQALDAILKGVETVVGQSFSDRDECIGVLKNIGQDSQTLFTNGNHNEIEKRAIQDERNKFIKFIDGLTDQQLETVEPLPFKRRILETEANAVRQRLLEQWNFDGGYWEPLTNCSPKPFIFFDKSNLTDNDFEKIKQIIVKQASDRLFSVSEERYDYEIDKSEFDPDCYETVYSDKTFDWIIYGSHEGTISFGGTWLLEEIEKQLSDKKELINQW